ncbi:MAG: hypothetical protein NVS3B10_04050 [Polyangiales bacterium]
MTVLRRAEKVNEICGVLGGFTAISGTRTGPSARRRSTALDAEAEVWESARGHGGT